MHPTPSTSTSPEPFRQSYSSSLPHGPSPTKRRKIATPSPVAQSPSSIRTSSVFLRHTPAPTPDPQLDAERRASSVRLLNTWSALKEKYARPIHKDDIVDLRSGALLKDRGVLSSDPRAWDIGCFADLDDAVYQESVGKPVADESGDEYGAWESESELNAQFAPVHVPPVRELDPLDAQDLQDFLAAEKDRRAAQGFDDDDVDDDEVAKNQSPPLPLQCSSPHNHSISLLRRNYGTDAEESVIEVEAGSILVVSSSESDDELYGYDDAAGEGALLWQIEGNVNPSKPVIMTPGHVPRYTSSMKDSSQSQLSTQLQTPPLSRSLSVPAVYALSSSSVTTSGNSISTLSCSAERLSQSLNSCVSPSKVNSSKARITSDSCSSSKHSSIPDKNSRKLLPREISISPTKRRPEVVLVRRRAGTVTQKAQASGPFDFTEQSKSIHGPEHIQQRSYSRSRSARRSYSPSSTNNSTQFKTLRKRKQILADDFVENSTSRDSSQSSCRSDSLDNDDESNERLAGNSVNKQQSFYKLSGSRHQGPLSPSHTRYFTSNGSPIHAQSSQPPSNNWSGMQPHPSIYLAQIGLSYLLGMAPTPNGWQHPPAPGAIPSAPYGSTSAPPWNFSSPTFPLAFPFTSPGIQPPPASPLTDSPLSYKRRRSRRVSFPQDVGGSENERDGDNADRAPTWNKGRTSRLRKAPGVSSGPSGDVAKAHRRNKGSTDLSKDKGKETERR